MFPGALTSRLWLPPSSAAHGPAVDHLLEWNLYLLGSFFVLAHLLLVLIYFRRGPTNAIVAHRAPPAWRVEFIPLTLICVTYMVLAVSAERLWAHNRFEGAAPQSMQVEVTGRQFQWYFRYPGRDAEFGQIDPAIIQPAAGNPLGIRPDDARGEDDVTTSELVLPEGREVDLTLRAQDVIHGFFIPAMRLKQNAVPGLVLHVHFTPTRAGTYPILCSQVCGLGHAHMQATLRVLTPPDFDAWLARREAERQKQVSP